MDAVQWKARVGGGRTLLPGVSLRVLAWKWDAWSIPLYGIPRSGKQLELHGRRARKAKLYPGAPVSSALARGEEENTGNLGTTGPAGEVAEQLLWAGNVHQTIRLFKLSN